MDILALPVVFLHEMMKKVTIQDRLRIRLVCRLVSTTVCLLFHAFHTRTYFYAHVLLFLSASEKKAWNGKYAPPQFIFPTIFYVFFFIFSRILSLKALRTVLSVLIWTAECCDTSGLLWKHCLMLYSKFSGFENLVASTHAGFVDHAEFLFESYDDPDCFLAGVGHFVFF